MEHGAIPQCFHDSAPRRPQKSPPATAQPAFRRCSSYLSDSRSLDTSGWASWASDRFDALVAPDNGCKGVFQIQHLGGRQSRFRENGSEGSTAHSWRADTTLCCLMDCFYEENHKGRESPRETAIRWQRENDEGAIGRKILSGQDRRVFWGPYGNTDLRAVWHHYFDSREKYERLSAIKQRFDPEGIFSASEFGVGYGSPRRHG